MYEIVLGIRHVYERRGHMLQQQQKCSCVKFVTAHSSRK